MENSKLKKVGHFGCFVSSRSLVNPLHLYISMHILHTCSRYISKEADKENLFHNQELLLVGDHLLNSHDFHI